MPAAPVIMESEDGLRWRTIARVPTDNRAPAYAGDPTLMRWRDRWWLTHQYSSAGRSRFTLRSSPDLRSWAKVAEVDPQVPGTVEVYPGTWAHNEDGSVWTDETDGRPRMFLTLTTGSVASGPFVLHELHPLDDAMTAWSAAVRISGDFPSNVIDPWLVHRGQAWFCWYKANDPGDEVIEVCASRTLMGPYRSHRSGDWAGWGRRCEAPCLVRLPNGSWRIYLQRYRRRTEGVWCSDSTDDWQTWSRLVPLVADLERDDHLSHGDVLYLSGPRPGTEVAPCAGPRRPVVTLPGGWMTSDRRRVELQIQLVRVTVRREASRLDAAAAAVMAERGRQILDALSDSVDDPDLRRAIDDARRELG